MSFEGSELQIQFSTTLKEISIYLLSNLFLVSKILPMTNLGEGIKGLCNESNCFTLGKWTIEDSLRHYHIDNLLTDKRWEGKYILQSYTGYFTHADGEKLINVTF